MVSAHVTHSQAGKSIRSIRSSMRSMTRMDMYCFPWFFRPYLSVSPPDVHELALHKPYTSYKITTILLISRNESAFSFSGWASPASWTPSSGPSIFQKSWWEVVILRPCNFCNKPWMSWGRGIHLLGMENSKKKHKSVYQKIILPYSADKVE